MECPFHAGNESVTTCAQCETPICPLCAGETNQIQLCMNCHSVRVEELSASLGSASLRPARDRRKVESRAPKSRKKEEGVTAPAQAADSMVAAESLWEIEDLEPGEAAPAAKAAVPAVEQPPSKKELARMAKEEAKRRKEEEKAAKAAVKGAPQEPVAPVAPVTIPEPPPFFEPVQEGPTAAPAAETAPPQAAPAREAVPAVEQPPSKKELARMAKEEAKRRKEEEKAAKAAVPAVEQPPSKKELARMAKEEAKRRKEEEKAAKAAVKGAPQEPVAPVAIPEPPPLFEPVQEGPNAAPAAEVAPPQAAPPQEAAPLLPDIPPLDFPTEPPTEGVKLPRLDERLEFPPPQESKDGPEGLQGMEPPEGFFD